MPSVDRYHALDALRGFAMFLGVLLHAAIPYMHTRIPFWPVRDVHRSIAFDVAMLAVHDFRMQTFFLLAGFFTALLYTRHGLAGTAIHRLKRIALPLGLAMLTIQPALQAVGVYAVAAKYEAGQFDVSVNPVLAGLLAAGDSPEAVVGRYFASGEFLHHMIPAHLWFLWYLLLCLGVMLPAARLADGLRNRALGRAWDSASRWLFRSRWRRPVLAALTWPALLLMESPVGPDTPLNWVPVWPLLGYYLLFFLVGWTLYRHRDTLGRFASGWRGSLLTANLLALPAAVVLLGLSRNPADAGPFRYPLHAVMALYTWLMVGGLFGLFLRFLSAERAWVRWLADSAYWCYLVSLPPVVAFQYLVVDWPTPAAGKFLVVTAATTATILVTYRLFVRYTWIGRLLNGPRQKPEHGRPRVAPGIAPVPVSGQGPLAAEITEPGLG